MADSIDRNARQWIDWREKVFTRGWRGRRDAAVSVFRERGLMMARWLVLFLVNGSGPSALLAVGMGGEDSGLATNWASYTRIIAFWADCISGHKLLHWHLLFPEIGYSTHVAVLRQMRTCSGWIFRPFGLTCSLYFSGDWISWGGCWSDMEENHLVIRPNHLSRLLVKIANSGVDSRVVVWIREFLLDRTQRVGV